MEFVEGTVVEVERNAARVQFPNGDSKWFTTNTDEERKRFALGNKLSCRKQKLPTDRDALFDFLVDTYNETGKLKFFVSMLEQKVEKGKMKGKIAVTGVAGLTISKAASVYGVATGSSFFVSKPDNTNVTEHHYNVPLEVEDGLVRITELVNAALLGTAAG